LGPKKGEEVGLKVGMKKRKINVERGMGNEEEVFKTIGEKTGESFLWISCYEFGEIK
jgi:hypothetical protein